VVTRSLTTKGVGDAAESAALAHLKGFGLTLVRRNYRVARGPHARGGEIDLILHVSATGPWCLSRCAAEWTRRTAGLRRVSELRSSAALCWRRVTSWPEWTRFRRAASNVVAIDGERVEWLRAVFDAD